MLDVICGKLNLHSKKYLTTLVDSYFNFICICRYLIAVTLPEFLLYIIGLPCIAVTIIMKNKHRLNEHDMMVRYGLLYLGYRKHREWWEITIVVRKVAVGKTHFLNKRLVCGTCLFDCVLISQLTLFIYLFVCSGRRNIWNIDACGRFTSLCSIVYCVY